MRRRIAVIVATSLVISSILGCGGDPVVTGTQATGVEEKENVSGGNMNEAVDSSKGTDSDKETVVNEIKQEDSEEIRMEINHPLMLDELGGETEEPVFNPRIAHYDVASDGSNIVNRDQFNYSSNQYEKLAENKFFVIPYGGLEFFDIYECNRYGLEPNFVTVDSMMHTYHLYYAMLQKHTEKNYLAEILADMSENLLGEVSGQYEILKGTEWESASIRALAFFEIGNILCGNDVDINPATEAIVESELEFIGEKNAIAKSPLMGEDEDYSQYKPRGYYDGDEELEKYFRAMMWYGRRNFTRSDEELDRSALLIALALDNAGIEDWNTIYSVTAFFAGASDDSGYYEYMPLIKQAYGDDVDASILPGNSKAFETFHKLTEKLPSPQINSIPMPDDEGQTVKTDVAKGFRFMGQRFSLDEAIFTQLTYSKLKENDNGDKRLIPDALDLPAALGSDTALEILAEEGDINYPQYLGKMDELRKSINENETLWKGSLYASWINTLRPMLTEKGEGYPEFMTNREWNKRSLEGFLGNYTELKHDSVLYSKQLMAEMGGGWEEEIDDRGYVEPEPLVFHRLAELTKKTAAGLEKLDVISKSDLKGLNELSELASRLCDISVKELNGDQVTEDDYELIRSYGGSLEHFWKDTVKDEKRLYDSEYITSDEFPAAVVVDIATDPNGSVLEEATGRVNQIVVVVPIEGKLKIAIGAVYSYYQFLQPINEERLTDREWRAKLGIELNDDMEYRPDESVVQPDWTQSYREERIFEN